MEKLNFKNVEYNKIDIGTIPENLKDIIEKIGAKSNDCLKNSYEIATHIFEINMVEGYLITYFEDESDIESVGHVWNEYNGEYFDNSIGLVKHNRKVKENEYFLAKTYTATEVLKEKVYYPPKNMYDLFPEVDTTKSKLGFSSDVKKNEKELKKFLNTKQ